MARSDTLPEASRVHSALWREKSGSERVAMALAMSDEARAITCAGILHHHPEWGEDRVRYEMLVRLYGAALVIAAWGSPPR